MQILYKKQPIFVVYLFFLMKQIAEIASIIHGDATCTSKYPNLLVFMSFIGRIFPSTRLFSTTRLFGTKEYSFFCFFWIYYKKNIYHGTEERKLLLLFLSQTEHFYNISGLDILSSSIKRIYRILQNV